MRTTNNHWVEIETDRLNYNTVHLDISQGGGFSGSRTATITVLLNDEDLEISVYSPNCDLNPVSVQKISKDQLEQFNKKPIISLVGQNLTLKLVLIFY